MEGATLRNALCNLESTIGPTWECRGVNTQMSVHGPAGLGRAMVTDSALKAVRPSGTGGWG